MTSQFKTRAKVWLVLFITFALGCVTGATLFGVYSARHRNERYDERGRRDAFMEKMQRELNLTVEQVARVNSIINDSRNDFRALRDEARPRFDAIRQKERERIREILTKQQQEQFDQMIARRNAERAQEDAERR